MPELLPLRHGRMVRSAFTFYRGIGIDDGVRSVFHAARPGSVFNAAATPTYATLEASRLRSERSFSL